MLFLFSLANKEEPKHREKNFFLEKLFWNCPKFFFENEKKIIKPSLYTSNGFGVGVFQTRKECEEKFGVPCFEQSFHPGPWEVRIYKSKHWHKTVAWHIDSAHAFYPEFPWDAEMKECFDRSLPDTSALAADIRVDESGKQIQIMEVNGVFGIPYGWAVEKNFAWAMFLFVLERIFMGMENFQISWKRMWRDILSVWHAVRLQTKGHGVMEKVQEGNWRKD